MNLKLIRSLCGQQGHELEEGQAALLNSEAQINEVIHVETHETPSEEEAISQAQKEFPLLDTSVNEPSEENLEVLQVRFYTP